MLRWRGVAGQLRAAQESKRELHDARASVRSLQEENAALCEAMAVLASEGAWRDACDREASRLRRQLAEAQMTIATLQRKNESLEERYRKLRQATNDPNYVLVSDSPDAKGGHHARHAAHSPPTPHVLQVGPAGPGGAMPAPIPRGDGGGSGSGRAAAGPTSPSPGGPSGRASPAPASASYGMPASRAASLRFESKALRGRDLLPAFHELPPSMQARLDVALKARDVKGWTPPTKPSVARAPGVGPEREVYPVYPPADSKAASALELIAGLMESGGNGKKLERIASIIAAKHGPREAWKPC